MNRVHSFQEVKSNLKELYIRGQLVIWRMRVSRQPPRKDHRNSIVLLVFEDITYCYFAEILILSTLRTNKNVTFRIFCDSRTKIQLEKRLKKLINLGRVKTEMLCNKYNSWQEAKVEVILRHMENNEVYFDSDMRVNGTLPSFLKTTFFAKEGDLLNTEPFSNLKSLFRVYCPNSLPWMNNTSVVYLDALTREKITKLGYSFALYEKEFREILNKSKLELEVKEPLWRLREQIFLSLLAIESSESIDFLLEKTERLDGQFIESVYFGSTGLRY